MRVAPWQGGNGRIVMADWITAAAISPTVDHFENHDIVRAEPVEAPKHLDRPESDGFVTDYVTFGDRSGRLPIRQKYQFSVNVVEYRFDADFARSRYAGVLSSGVYP